MEIVIGIGAVWMVGAAVLTGGLCRAAALGDRAWAHAGGTAPSAR